MIEGTLVIAYDIVSYINIDSNSKIQYLNIFEDQNTVQMLAHDIFSILKVGVGSSAATVLSWWSDLKI